MERRFEAGQQVHLSFLCHALPCFLHSHAGSLLTCGALVIASHQLRVGNRKAFNRALRWRIYFQGLTAIAAVGGVYYYGLAKPAIPPEVALGADGQPLDPAAAAAAAASPYSNVATIPGRPPTNLQVNKQGDREAQSRREWEERMRDAQKREAEAEDQRRLEAALLKGTGVAPQAGETGEERRKRPTIGKDRRTRGEE